MLSPDELLAIVSEQYSLGTNINQFLRANHPELSEDQIIRLSYEAQAGSYVAERQQNLPGYNQYSRCLSQKISALLPSVSSILDAGCGELTSSLDLIQLLTSHRYFALDGSFSRLLVARSFLNSLVQSKVQNVEFITGSLLNLPFSSNSIDLVFTSHALEPNRTNSSLLISELVRVSRRYICLFEPCYETATQSMKAHMDLHNYARNIHRDCLRHGLTLISSEPILESIDPATNLTTFSIYTKETTTPVVDSDLFVSPNSVRSNLSVLSDGALYSRSESLIYPCVQNIMLIDDMYKIHVKNSDYLL